ncbi:hypothetical protein NLI96_g1190 [Meripilus lineatus]|uniref:DUF6533 domain-containing protein n=1 Tax=Meripilus lineatus TaxID=2056292 RepID=A0AAD5VBB9_9APHY|nr:hypothetical protein NLI96_g1190 [Physisporinus lineatus]
MDSDDFAPDQVHLHNRLFLMGVAILYYDFLLTLGDEVECVWCVRKTISVWLFLVNRYFPLLAGIALCAANFIPFETIEYVETLSLEFYTQWVSKGNHSVASISMGCNFSHDQKAAVHSAAAFEAIFVFDLLIFVLTVSRTYRIARFTSRSFMSLDGLTELVFRDGAIYFGYIPRTLSFCSG